MSTTVLIIVCAIMLIVFTILNVKFKEEFKRRYFQAGVTIVCLILLYVNHFMLSSEQNIYPLVMITVFFLAVNVIYPFIKKK